MKNIIIILGIILTISLFSCDKNQGFGGGTQWVKKEAVKNTYEIIEIEGCEYIYVSVNSGYAGGLGLTHKGNCKNPIHNCNCNN